MVESAADILEELGGFLQAVPKQQQLPLMDTKSDTKSDTKFDTKLAKLLAQIDYATTPFDVIVLRSGLTVGEVSSIILSLELAGCVESVTGGYTRI